MLSNNTTSNTDLSYYKNIPIISLSKVAKVFSKKQVLKSITLNLTPGKLIALVGNNGQGKTTLIKLMLGLLQADAGDIFINGQLASSLRTAKQKALIGYLPETTAFYPNLTGQETLSYFSALKQAPSNKIDELFKTVGLDQAKNYRVKTYSKGMKQRLGLAQALLGSPKLLLLDEPTNGLDPSGINEFYQVLEKLKNSNVSILMSSHLLAEVETRADELAFLKNGVIRVYGTVDELINAANLPSIIKFHKGAAFNQNILNEILQLHDLEEKYIPQTEMFVITCQPAQKQQLLLALLSSSELITKLSVNDPGLEQLFLQLNSNMAIT